MLSRRTALKLTGAAAVAPALRTRADPPGADHTLEITRGTLQLSPHHQLKTDVYNGQAPGPLLRLKEGRPVTIEVINRTDHPEVVHWHGLYLDPSVDGSIEEGTPPIPPGASARYTFKPEPAGFRWYHTHMMAMGNFARGLYSGQHGLLMIEARDDPGGYDQELFLALHDWKPYLSASDIGMNPSYPLSTINGRMLGFSEPLRVKQGERVLMHVLNTSPTETHWIALAGHQFHVVALDGNAVPTPGSVSMLRLAPAERVCALVQMSNPGVWILGEVRKHVQAAGMGVVLEYAGERGTPRWEQPSELVWNYRQFAAAGAAAQPAGHPVIVPMVFEPRFRGHGAMEGWTINGKSFPDTSAAPLMKGRRYRLQFINRSQDEHPLHLHRHSFELRTLGAALGTAGDSPAGSIRGILKDVVLLDPQTQAEVEFTADHPGATLFHCHQQSHQDLGFMLLFHYA
jgi:FtsP/CotA-like multicopper oxidase with cupredoxin domain